MTSYSWVRSIGRSVVARLFIAGVLSGSALAPSAALALDVPTDCISDSDGANDVSAKQDLTKFCLDVGAGTPYELDAIANFDFTTLGGGSSSDVCFLFNTDGDAFANLAICVSVSGSGPLNGNLVEIDEIRLFTCDDSKADRCAGQVLVGGPYSTTCEVSVQNTDPFPGPAPGPGEDYPADTELLCGFDLDGDFGLTDVIPHDTCSYSSNNPNSAPSDCLSFATCASDVDCDDGNPCTADTCDAVGVCEFTPTPGAVCDDGIYCNGEEECNELGLCSQGTGGPVDCNDDVDCTLDECDELGDVCVNEPMNTLCSDGLFCTGVETCDPVNDCQAGTPPDCGDFVGCTTDTCNEDIDDCVHTPVNSECSDGNFCNGDEVCDEIDGCEPGTTVDCDDGVGCTTDSCDEAEDECVNSLNHAACDDGLYCTGEESCTPIGCATSPAIDCDDGIDCTTDECNEAADSCLNTQNDAACDDGNFCDGAETCESTGCEEGTPPTCNDGVDCTTDSCDTVGNECDHVPNDAFCSNGDFCDGNETCDAVNDCQPGTTVDCDDGVSCTIDSCNEAEDECVNALNHASCDDGLYCTGEESCTPIGCATSPNVDCDDGIECTADVCDEDFDQCDNTPNNASCDDGVFCNGEEICGSTGCEAGEPPLCSDGIDCTDDSCNGTTDECENVVDHDFCDDGVFCDGEEICDPVDDCEEGTPPTCDDGVDCTIDDCDQADDECVHVTSDAFCSNGIHCDGVETCDEVNDCQSGTPVDCDDTIECTTDSCNEDTDSCVNAPDNASCSDGDFCTGVEICNPSTGCDPGTNPCPGLTCNEVDDLCTGCSEDADCQNGVYCDGAEVCLDGTCMAGAPVVCDDDVDCTVDTCDEAIDSCDFAPSDAFCDNDLFCDGEETCDPEEDCVGGTPVDCNDDVDCTVDTCDEATDSCDFTTDDDFCDNDLFCDGEETCDPEEDCVGGTPVDCNDDIGCTADSCSEADDECVNAPDNAPCSNGVFCDGVEVCTEGVGCEDGPVPTCDDDVDCTVDSCYLIGDVCQHVPNNAFCDNGAHCDGVETCDITNDCQAGTPVDCGDGINCTIDSCNEQTDLCEHTADDSICSDGNFCSGEETCIVGVGCAIPPVVDCDDGLECTQDSCNESTDQCDNIPDNDPCQDDTFCNGEEICDPETGCEAAEEPMDCDDGVECTLDSCDEEGDECVNEASNALCDDATYCNGDEVCTSEGCEDGTPVDCDDGLGCTADACNEGMDTCTHTPDNNACTDMLHCNGVEICNVSQGCVAGSPPNCMDQFNCTTDTCNESTDSCEHSFATCECGDMEMTGSEECDPAAMAGSFEDCNDNLDNDMDGRIDCRDQDCKPGARDPVCDEQCTLDQVCVRFIRDPARVYYSRGDGPDEFYIHGRIPMRGETLRSVVHAVTVELSNPYGPIYRAYLDAGDMRGGVAGKRFKFRDDDARHLGQMSARNGLQRVWVRTRKFSGVRYLVFTIRAYGDFSKATHRLMTTELAVGPEVGYLTQEWQATPRGWVLHQKDFDNVGPEQLEEMEALDELISK